jgi:hypothetical protein
MKRHFAFLILTVVALALSGCAKARHVAVVVDAGLYESLNTVHAVEQDALCGAPSCAGQPDMPVPGYSKDKSMAFNQALLPAIGAGRQLNTQLAAWKSDQPVPASVAVVINGLADSLTAVTKDFPAGSARERMLAAIAQGQRLALALLSSVLTVAAAR